jgi:hypothetical protein
MLSKMEKRLITAIVLGLITGGIIGIWMARAGMFE